MNIFITFAILFTFLFVLYLVRDVCSFIYNKTSKHTSLIVPVIMAFLASLFWGVCL